MEDIQQHLHPEMLAVPGVVFSARHAEIVRASKETP
jgi:hypothetical protein